MIRRSMLAAVLVGMIATSVLGQSQEPANLFDNAKNAYMMLQYDIAGQGPDGKMVVQTLGGPAVCIDASGVFMTFGIERGMQPSPDTTTAPAQAGLFSNLKIVELGLDGNRYDAQYLSTDAITGLSFVRVTQQGARFTAINFVETSPTVGQRLVSVGVMPGEVAFTRYMGLAYASAEVRLPNRSWFVTGGSLTASLSAVMAPNGQAIGMVFPTEPARVFQSTLRMQNQQAAQIGLIGQLERQYFVPTSEFAEVIRNYSQARQLPWMGVLQFSGVPGQAAVVAQGVLGEQPAAQAGLKENDVVVAMNNQPVERLTTPQLTAAAFVQRFLRNSAGDTISLTIQAPDAAARTIQVKLDPQPAMAEDASKHLSLPLGLLVRDRVLLDRYVLPGKSASASGVLVMAIVQGGLSEQLQANDVVTAINGEAIATVRDFQTVTEAANAAGRPVTLTVMRGEEQLEPIRLVVPQEAQPATAPATAPAAR